jgi:hypothetical protein
VIFRTSPEGLRNSQWNYDHYGTASTDHTLKLKQVPQFSSRSFMVNLFDCGDRSRLLRASTSGKHTQDLPSDGFFLVIALAFMMQDLS